MAQYPIIQLPADSTKIRFKEPYASEGLNLKLAGIIPCGIFRGFNPSALPNYLLYINTDGVSNDSVAVIETSPAFSTARFNLTVRTTQQIVLDFMGHNFVESGPLYVVIRAQYAISPSPLVGMTDAKVLAVRTALNNADPKSLHDGDIKICKVIDCSGPGNTPVISMLIPSDRQDNGGPLPTAWEGAFRASRFEWWIPSPPPLSGSFGTGPLSFPPKLALATAIGRETACFSYILGVGDWYMLSNIHNVDTDYSSWVDKHYGGNSEHPIYLYREAFVELYADLSSFGQSGVTFDYQIVGGGTSWRVNLVILG